jgi:hypothetical protein
MDFLISSAPGCLNPLLSIYESSFLNPLFEDSAGVRACANSTFFLMQVNATSYMISRLLHKYFKGIPEFVKAVFQLIRFVSRDQYVFLLFRLVSSRETIPQHALVGQSSPERQLHLFDVQ